MEALNSFNIRVYAIIFDEERKYVLLSDEYREGMYMTKFPGGGLQFGEGTIKCLQREAVEEFGQEVEIVEHFYTTDFFQKAMFFENQQLISIYYIAKLKEQQRFKISNKKFDFPESMDGGQSFRWFPIKCLNPEILTFPIDKKVAEMLVNRIK